MLRELWDPIHEPSAEGAKVDEENSGPVGFGPIATKKALFQSSRVLPAVKPDPTFIKTKASVAIPAGAKVAGRWIDGT